MPANELRQVKQLLWTVIAEKLNPAEVDEVSPRGTFSLTVTPSEHPVLIQIPVPVPVSQVRRALGSSAIEENDQLMMEADALAEIIGDVRQRTDATAHARRLYDNPRRALIEGELRLLVQSIKRCASGDYAEASGRPGSTGSASSQEREIRWQDIGSGTVNDPMVESAEQEAGARAASADPAAAKRAEKLMAGDTRERKMLDYVTGVADAAAIRAGTPRTPPSRPASSVAASSSRPGTAASVGSGGSSGSALGNPVAAVEQFGGKINAFDVDKVAIPLKELLAEERVALLDDVEYLQTCLEDEADRGKRVEAPAPKVEELTAYGDKLREVWEGEKERAEHIVKVERMFDQPLAKGRVGKLRSMAATLKSEDVNGDGGDLDDDTSARVDRLVIDDKGSTKHVPTPVPPSGAPPLVPRPPGAPPRGGRPRAARK